MIKLGHYNTLRINRFTDYGAYLVDPTGTAEINDAAGTEIRRKTRQAEPEKDYAEVLLPSKYVCSDMAVGDEIEVFVYLDSEDRPVAVLEKPFAEVGQFAFLQVADVNKVGAFLDWGLPKNILVPFKEQNMRMLRGGVYPVYIYLDHTTGRIVASAKLEKFLNNVYPDFHVGEVVSCLVLCRAEHGYKVIVNNRHSGMIYDSDLHRPLTIQLTIKARVKKVRDDGKIDLTPGGRTDLRVEELAGGILEKLRATPEGSIGVGDKSSPEIIDRMFKCSKKDFKRAIGYLYKHRNIALADDRITLLTTK